MQSDPYRTRARLRVWQAARAWFPNRHAAPLHPAERLAEDGGDRLREAALATGNRSLVASIDALRVYALERRKN